MKILTCIQSQTGSGIGLLSNAFILLTVLASVVKQPALWGQEGEVQQPVDHSRFKEVGDQVTQLKKLRTELGAGHPRVQDILRKLKLLEEDLRMEQTFSERLAAQLRVSEDELREKQKLELDKLQLIEVAVKDQSDEPLPSLETIEALERQALTELQRIDWELASDGTTEASENQPDVFHADELRVKSLQLTRDLAKLKLDAARERQANSKSPATTSQDKLIVQMATLEFGIAEANLQAAEIDLTAKKNLAKNLPAEKLKKMNERRAVVENQLKGLPAKKELAKQLMESEQSCNLLAQQIRDLEMQRIQYQSKSTELNELLEIVRQTLAASFPSKRSPKSIN